jgi:hypothetical protein
MLSSIAYLKNFVKQQKKMGITAFCRNPHFGGREVGNIEPTQGGCGASCDGI